MSYAELQVTSNFSFLRGASDPEELVIQAAKFGYKGIAITDVNTLAGIVRAHVAAKKHHIKFIPGCRLELQDAPPLLAYPTDQSAYSRLSKLLSTGNLRTEKGQCLLYRNDVFLHKEGIIFIALPPAVLNNRFDFDPDFREALADYKSAFGNNLYLAGSRNYLGYDQKRMFRISRLSEELGIPIAAVNDVVYHEPKRRELQDILTCVREKCTIYDAGYLLHQNAERHLKSVSEMQRLFYLLPDAIENTIKIADRCQFSLDSLKYIYPEELTSEGRSPMEELIHLTWLGAREKFGSEITEKIKETIAHELKFIREKNYASYFLTVHDLVRFARSQKILCQGRGSAANSVVCFCLGITSVNPKKIDLLFERFISSARNEPPDIDVDFEHERREEVIQYIYNKYGRDRTAIVATVTQQRQKGAIRDVGKAMGLSVDTINKISAAVWHFSDDIFDGKRLKEQGLNPEDPHLHKVLELTAQMIGFPRQLGQHTGGFVITQGKITDLCPILNARMEDRTNIEWNKDDIEALGFLKVDVLALGMLTCVRKAFDLARAHYGLDLKMARILEKEETEEGKPVYDMICRADTMGTFQIESRAQMSMLPRLKPREFYDLVIEVAIVRPGPIQGDMVHPYLKRRENPGLVDYPSPKLEDILKKTLGVPLFQEQAMKIAIDAAGFTPAEADELRRSMATFKAKGKVEEFERKLIGGMLKNGYEEDFARRVFNQLKGFGSYGFPESHAASFALLVYVSCWLKHYYPDIFLAALLNSMPMGFYQPAQLVADARAHGVEVREADINLSCWDNKLEETQPAKHAVRLGFRQIKGVNEAEMQALVMGRKNGYTQIYQLLDAGVCMEALEKLADADAFRSLGMDRRQALWEVAALGDRPVAIFSEQPSASSFETQVELPLMTLAEHVIQDYASTTLSLKAHPLSFIREKLILLQITKASQLKDIADGGLVKVAGLILVRQRPGTASGICFITLEDESGSCNLVVFQELFEKYRKEILQSRLLMAEGRMQREGHVVHIIVQRCFNYNGLLNSINVFHSGRNFK